MQRVQEQRQDFSGVALGAMVIFGTGPISLANELCLFFASGRLLCLLLQMMVPGRRDCFPGWTKEYEGYLMTGPSGTRAQHNYVCVDGAPEVNQLRVPRTIETRITEV